MVVISSVIAVVSAVSLYEYFSARSWQQVTSQTRNNLVFENRNQKYGAYILRRDYDKRLMLILLIFSFSIGSIYGSYLYLRTPYSQFKKTFTDPTAYPLIPPVIEKTENEPEKEPEKPEEVKPNTPPPSFEFLAPIVVDNGDVNDINLLDENAGLKTIKDGNPINPIVPSTLSATTIDVTPEPPTDFPDIDAQFPGGNIERFKFLSDELIFPPDEVNGEGGKCLLNFVVTKEGEIKNIKIIKGIEHCKSCDQEAIRVIKSMPKWEPATTKNKPVDSYFNMTIYFKVL